jgi:hypothetical protein
LDERLGGAALAHHEQVDAGLENSRRKHMTTAIIGLGNIGT